MRRVILTGMFAPYEEPLRPGDEIWTVNYGYRNQADLARLYVLHDIGHFFRTPGRKAEFLREVNGGGFRVILREKCPEIPRAERYPIEDVLAALPYPYFTSGLAYMLAAAIRERADVLRLHRIHVMPGAAEYLAQKANAEFWLGLAIGQGIRVELSVDSDLLRAYPWDTPLYGYAPVLTDAVVPRAITRAVRENLGTPTRVAFNARAFELLGSSAIERYPVEETADPGPPPDVLTEPVLGAIPGGHHA
ncbi:MAG: hypothetical protein FD189_1108 [Elusimicrobia bacterium]|nr:MAG: hypothetical protein FD189_1108 [Elusimicrobiota bacterium]